MNAPRAACIAERGVLRTAGRGDTGARCIHSGTSKTSRYCQKKICGANDKMHSETSKFSTLGLAAAGRLDRGRHARFTRSAMTPSPASRTQNAWTLALAITALVVAAAALVLAVRAQLPKSGKKTAPEFAIVDHNEALRGRFTSQGLTLIDGDGRLRAHVTTGISGAPDLALFAGDGKLRAILGLGSDDTPGFTLHDKTGRVRVRLSVGADDVPSMTFYDAQGKVTSRLPLPDTQATPVGAPTPVGARPHGQPPSKSSRSTSR